MLEVALIYLSVGALAGVLAGLFGVGGGAVIVPALLFAFQLAEIDASVSMQLAIGTSLASIIFTGSASVLAHHRHGNVSWPHMGRLLVGILLGTPLGAWAATSLPAATLERVFGIFLLLVALKMLASYKPRQGQRKMHVASFPAAGLVIGAVSGLLGIGGGTLSVPFLSYSGLPMRKAVATSAACGLPIALSGAASYAVAGYGRPELPSLSVGYVYLPGFALVALMSTMTARYGARWATRLPEQRLRQAFAAILALVATKMLLS